MNEASRSLFDGKARELPSLETEGEVISNAFTILNFVKSNFAARKLFLAGACSDFLISKKTRMIDGRHHVDKRRDEITPDFLHELRQILAADAFCQAQMLPSNSRYGNIEVLFCAIFLHDMGEDFKVMPAEMYQWLINKIAEDPRINTKGIQGKYQEMAQRAVSIMERMTLDRKYTAAEICECLSLPKDTALSFANLQEFVGKLNGGGKITEIEREKPLQILPDANKNGMYVVSRYIHNNIIDWNLYIESMMQDPYAILAKFFDRNEGLSTRIGKTFNIDSYSDYLTKTFMSFSIDNISHDLVIQYPEFAIAFESLDAMMGALHRIGRTYVTHHPGNKANTYKGFNISTMRNIDFRDYFPKGFRGYEKLPGEGLNPLPMIMARIRQSKDLGFDQVGVSNAHILHQRIQESIQASARNNQESRGFLAQLAKTFEPRKA